MELQRPVPRPTPLTRPFWDGCRERRLLVQRCHDCGAHVFIPQEWCAECLGNDLRWVESSGTGEVVTYTVVSRSQTPAFETPYVIAVVRLAEGHEMMTNIIGPDATAVQIGDPVEVSFVPIDPDVTLPCFQRVSA